MRIAQASTDASGEVSLAFVRPSSELSVVGQDEQVAFQFFKLHMQDSLHGLCGRTIWAGDILPISIREPSIRYAVVALGALGKEKRLASSSACLSKQTKLARQSYSKAMKALQTKIELKEQMTPDMVLLSCLLFVTFELYVEDFPAAKCHLDSGLSIIREIRDGSSTPTTPTSKQTMSSLVESFERLDIQMSFLRAERVQLNRSQELAQSTLLPCATRFDSIHDARCSLNINMAAMRELIWLVEQTTCDSYGGMSSDDMVSLSREQTRQIVSLRRWEEAVDDLLSRTTAPLLVLAGHQLRMQQLSCALMVSMALSCGRETLWDDHLEEFDKIAELGAKILQTRSTNVQAAEGDSTFTLDMGIIPPLYMTVMKCRDPQIRHTALKYLKQCTHQEGPFNGPQICAAASAVVMIEEKGRVFENAGDLPEQDRLYQAYFVLQERPWYVNCVRRSSEGDRRWLKWRVVLG
ncbi:hypothetical protein LTR78_007646 [Recurvomyces mirabilis]|uniref:Uncharacterized protein n=1 Tax=Recurvomyces mirabilis TaxID=574656 RepID=A0AAE0TRS5_9PEZI|nr:hypothetical protein LTR78_007646 [Recurvomyces mirabilis]